MAALCGSGRRSEVGNQRSEVGSWRLARGFCACRCADRERWCCFAHVARLDLAPSRLRMRLPAELDCFSRGPSAGVTAGSYVETLRWLMRGSSLRCERSRRRERWERAQESCRRRTSEYDARVVQALET